MEDGRFGNGSNWMGGNRSKASKSMKKDPMGNILFAATGQPVYEYKEDPQTRKPKSGNQGNP